MSNSGKTRIAIVAALEREVRPLIRGWHVSERGREGRKFRFYEHDDVVLVCGGIGGAAARRAAEAVIAIYSPAVIYSVGFAGALDPSLKIGDVVEPSHVIDASDGSRIRLAEGSGILVSVGTLASSSQKAKLKESYGAQLVDMEAAAVWHAADARGVVFAAVKSISDEFDFSFPEIERFVDSQGRFQEGRFAVFALLRPWLWPKVVQMARNSNRAALGLTDRLVGRFSGLPKSVPVVEEIH